MKAKLVKEDINENIKFKGHEFKIIKLNRDSIYVGEEGLLGHDNVLIPWDLIEKLKKQYES